MTTNPPPADKPAYVQDVFTRIAPRYDLMNRLMTAGQDVAWRKEVIGRARLRPGDRLLDLGAGTGDLAREGLRQEPGVWAIAADYTLRMMAVGRARYGCPRDWSTADALHLPFPDASFDALVSGFLLRNVASVDTALAEMLRVLKPGGRMVALDTTRPGKTLLSPFIRFHMMRVIPTLGTLITGQRDAYTYLPVSSENFLQAEDLLAKIEAAGFARAGFRRRMFGTVAVHWGEKGF
jgi:demethylmenaquinone methyltransferase/2-methoxy-6-polyprenyl-1,4-benzoquinol methylase